MNFLVVLSIIFAGNSFAATQAPEYIYHVGKVTHLYQDIADHTISQKIWDDAIMSNKTRFELPTSRRGLYGAAHATTAYYYGDDLAAPWVMKIKIAENCRKNVFQTFEDTQPQSPFMKWVHSQKNINQQTISNCTARYNGIRYWDVDSEDFGTRDGNICTTILNRYFIAAKVGVVVDTSWRDSFYIRERDCIEDISGTPNDWWTDLSHQSEILSTENWYDGGHRALTMIFKRILKETTLMNQYDIKTVLNIVQKVKKSTQAPKDSDETLAVNTMFYLTQEISRCMDQGHLTEAQNAINLSKSNIWKSQKLCQ